MSTKVAVMFDYGAVSAAELVVASAGRYELLFAVSPDSDYAIRSLPMLREGGSVEIWKDEAALRDRLTADRVAGILCFSDNMIIPTARLAEALNLPGTGVLGSRRLVNKLAQRRQLRERGLESVRFADVSTPDLVGQALGAVGIPAVVKPCIATGSRHASLVRSYDECLSAVSAARSSGEGALILEEFLEGDRGIAGPAWGDYVSVESVISNGKVLHIGVTGKPPLAAPFRETGAVFPAPIDRDVEASCLKHAHAALEALEVGTGVYHTELKLTPAGPRLIEINGRLGGYVNDIVFRSCRLRPLDVAFDVALGRYPDLSAVSTPAGVAYQFMMLPPIDAHTLISIDNVNEFRNSVAGITRVTVLKQPGSRVDWVAGTSSAILVVAGLAADHQHAAEVRKSLATIVKANYRY